MKSALTLLAVLAFSFTVSAQMSLPKIDLSKIQDVVETIRTTFGKKSISGPDAIRAAKAHDTVLVKYSFPNLTAIPAVGTQQRAALETALIDEAQSLHVRMDNLENARVLLERDAAKTSINPLMKSFAARAAAKLPAVNSELNYLRQARAIIERLKGKVTLEMPLSPAEMGVLKVYKFQSAKTILRAADRDALLLRVGELEKSDAVRFESFTRVSPRGWKILARYAKPGAIVGIVGAIGVGTYLTVGDIETTSTEQRLRDDSVNTDDVSIYIPEN